MSVKKWFVDVHSRIRRIPYMHTMYGVRSTSYKVGNGRARTSYGVRRQYTAQSDKKTPHPTHTELVQSEIQLALSLVPRQQARSPACDPSASIQLWLTQLVLRGTLAFLRGPWLSRRRLPSSVFRLPSSLGSGTSLSSPPAASSR